MILMVLWMNQTDHLSIVELMLEKGANNYNETMETTSNIVELMLEKGADNYNEAMTYVMSDTKEYCICYEATEHLTPCKHLICESCYSQVLTCPM